jgi:chromosome segregation ATPase
MTVLGKILVFINLVFSLLTGGLIVMVFLTRAQWNDAFKKQQDAYKIAVAQAQADVKAVQDQVQAKQGEVDAAKRDREDVTRQLTDAQAKFAGVRDQLTQLTTQKDAETRNLTALTEEVNRRRDEVKLLQTQLASRDKKVVDLEKSLTAQRDQAVQYKIERDASIERNRTLLAQVEAQSRQINAVRQPGSPAPAAAAQLRKPAEDVRGQVTEVNGSFVSVSIGSDAGVTKNNVLQVYRLSPPEYVGTLEILEARPSEAVGRFKPAQPRSRVQKGDEVASNILPGGGVR